MPPSAALEAVAKPSLDAEARVTAGLKWPAGLEGRAISRAP
jgi:hypothetical protein